MLIDNAFIFQAVYPTGTTVTIMRNAVRGYNILNVWVKPSSADYGQTEGKSTHVSQKVNG